MNITLNVLDENINTDIVHFVKFLDKKKNMIMDGDFTKLVYSDDVLTLNGIYLTCPFVFKHSDNIVQILQPPNKSISSNSLRNANTGNEFNKTIRNKTYVNRDRYKKEVSYNTDNATEWKHNNNEQKHILRIYPYNPKNENIIQNLTNIERCILNEYILINSYDDFSKKQKPLDKKQPIFALKNQLLSGCIKYYYNFVYPYKYTYNLNTPDATISTNNLSTNNQSKHYLLKISGIWETNDNYGITYKFIETVV
jgi:hypothetical protein